MRCVQREAGAPGLAPTPSTGSPSRAEARSAGGACFRRHLLALLLAVPGLFTGAPGLVVAPTALLLGALSLFHATPASAAVLVSNIGQTQTSSNWVIDGYVVAQGFTTGSNANGYKLTSIDVVLALVPSGARQKIRAELWSSATGGGPSAKLATLTIPASVTTGTVSFAAPSSTTLSANTTYYFIIYTTDNSSAVSMNSTQSNNEDSTSAAGWSIANSSYYNSGNAPVAASFQVYANFMLLIRVNGAAVPTAPSAPTNLVVTPGDGSLDLSWTAAAGTVTGYDLHFTSAPSSGAGAVANDAAVAAPGTDFSTAWIAADVSDDTDTMESLALANGTTFRVRVRARNSGGNSAWVFGTGTPAAPSDDATLSGLTVSGSATAGGTYTALTLSPAFDSATTEYTAEVAATVSHVKLRPTANDGGATLKAGLQGTPSALASGSETGALSLEQPGGRAVLLVEVTAEDESTMKTYEVTVTRQWAAPTSFTVTPGSGSLALSWTAPSGVAPSGYDVHYTSAAAADVTNDAAASGSDASAAWVAVTRSGSTATQAISSLSNGTTYRVRVRARASGGGGGNADILGAWVFGTGTPSASSVSTLSALTATSSTSAGGTFSALTLSPATFASDTTAYTASVENTVTHVKITPTVSASGATVQVGHKGTSLTTVTSASASGAIELSGGSNVLVVRVTSANGNVNQDYTVTVTRAAMFTPFLTITGTEGDSVSLTVQLSTAAPSGGVEFSLTPLYGNDAEVTGLCAATDRKADANDLTNPPSTLTVAAGQTAAEATFLLADDGVVDTDECFAIRTTTSAAGWTAAERPVDTENPNPPDGTTLVNIWQHERAYIAFGNSASVITSVGNAPARTTAYTVTVAENSGGGTVNVPVTVAQLPVEEATVSIEVISTGTTATEYVDAANPGDFRIATKSVTFGPSTAKTQNLAVSLTDDGATESNETIGLRIEAAPSSKSDPKDYYQRHSAGSTATITLTDPLPSVSFELGTLQAAESAAAAEIKVVLSQALSQTVTVNVRAGAGATATAGEDYSLSANSVTFAAGETEQSVYLTTVADETTEGTTNEMVTLELADLPVEVTAGTNGSLEVTIIDDSQTPLRPVVSAGNGELNLSWSDPGTNPAGYDVQYTSAGAGAVGDNAAVTTGEASAGWVDGSHTGTTTSHTLTGLVNGTTYRVRVRATFSGNSNGDWEVVRGTPSDASLSVTATPACGSVVTGADLSVKPLVRLQVATVTGVETEIELRLVDAQGNPISTTSSRPEGWQRTLSVRPIAYTPLGADTTFARFQTWTGFAGFQFRLRDNPSVTAECIWQLDHSGGVTPTDTTTTTTTTTPPRNPPTGGGGNTGGGGGRPRDLRPSFGSASVPDQSYTEGTEITPLELPAATGGNGRLFYALSPVLPEGLTLNRRVRRLSGTPTSPHAAREYTWTATDADGDAARITFTVTVAPDRPSFDNVSVPDQSYTEGTAITPLVLPEATGGNNPLTYGLTPAPPNGLSLNDVTRRLSGNPISPQDTTRYTWTATDADGDEATLTFTMTIAVDPHRERIRELARRVLAEMARRAMSGALDTIGARFGAIGGSGLSLAGQPVSLESVASVADGVGMAVWNNQSLALGELLEESAFSLRLAATEEVGDGVNSEGPLWSVWGRGDLASFAGGREEETHYDGWLRSGWLGLDARSGRWVGGMALSHEQGQADYGATMAAASDRPLQGRLETSLTALYPYGRWQLTDGMELQGVVGVGWGEAHHTPADDPRETGTLSMKMASLGVRKSLPDVAGLALALRADAAVTRIETADGPDTIHNLSADSWRLRTGLEASRRFSLEGEAFLEPFLEAAARQDGGDGLEGSGVELAGGLRYSAPNVAVELRGRWLAAHSEEGAEEQGVSLTARYGPGADGQGLFFALSPRWGAATGGAQALWGEDLPVLSTASAGNSGAVDAQVGYGFALPQGGVLTPFAEVGMAGADSRRLRLGTRYAATVTGLEMAVEVAGERRESGDAAAEHALQLDVDLQF